MAEKTPENVTDTIKQITEKEGITLKEGDATALSKAYLKHGDVDLALDNEGNVLSDVMNGEHLDTIAEGLNNVYGEPPQTRPHTVRGILINGYLYHVYTDDQGATRFVGNKAVQAVVREQQRKFNEYMSAVDQDDLEEPFSLGKLGKLYESGEISWKEWLDFHSYLGYSLDTLKLLPEFENIRIEVTPSN